MGKQIIATDKDDAPIYPGDTVVDMAGNETVVQWGQYRDKYNGGWIYGYAIPDYCRKIKSYDDITGLVKDGMEYRRCKHCPLSSEKFVSTTEGVSPIDGRQTFFVLHNIKRALNNGYKPLYD